MRSFSVAAAASKCAGVPPLHRRRAMMMSLAASSEELALPTDNTASSHQRCAVYSNQEIHDIGIVSDGKRLK